jgi:hypothetical protein
LLTTATLVNGSLAYFLIQKPGSTGTFAFQRTAVGSHTWTCHFSPGGFAAPAAPDTIPGGLAADVVVYVTATAIFSTNANTRVQMGADDAAGYGFWMLSHTSGQPTTKSLQIFLDPLEAGSYPAADTEPWIFSIVNSTNAWDTTSLSYNTALPTATFHCGYLGASGTPANCLPIQADAMASVPYYLGTNCFTGLDETSKLRWCRSSAYGAPRGVKGNSTLMRWTGMRRSMGSTMSLYSIRDRYVIGDILLPWDGSDVKI